MSDPIERREAIAALGERPMVWTGSDYELGARNQYDMDKLAIETVPPAQPYTDEKIQKIQDLEQAQFDKICELAYQKGKADMQAEQKRGKWKQISPAGIYECSVCGQNVMTGDIEVYLYCHGCGAKMEVIE